jgi:hypothetical protein
LWNKTIEFSSNPQRFWLLVKYGDFADKCRRQEEERYRPPDNADSVEYRCPPLRLAALSVTLLLFDRIFTVTHTVAIDFRVVECHCAWVDVA